ncbi:MAG: hypothetical protein GTO28_14620, partial [Gammaproteobacteria bacterium]|nr:hypothetical protein [Gammaproteobacteria bacterium]
PLRDVRLALVGLELPFPGRLVLVALAVQLVELGLELRDALLCRDGTVDVDVEAPFPT